MRSIVFVCFVFLANASNAQIYSFTQFTKADGLPSAFIYDIAQDDKGFLTVATGDGVGSYNGSKFVTFDTTHGLADNIISCLSKNDRGEIITGHLRKGLSIRSGARFVSIEGTKQMESPVNCLFSQEDKIFFGTSSGFLGVFEKSGTKLTALQGATFINKISKAGGVILIATDNGLYKFNEDKSASLIESTKGIHFTGLTSYLNNQVLAGTDRGELYIYKVQNSGKILEQVSVTMVCKNVPVKSIINSSANKLLIASWGNGIYSAEINRNTSLLENKKNIAAANGLGGLFVNVLYKDFNDNVWIGTFGNGVYKLNNTHFKVYNQKSGLYQDRVSAVLASGNKVYLGSESGLQVLNTSHDDSLLVYNSANRFKNAKVSTLARFNENTLLVGTEKYGLFLFDTKRQTFTEYFDKMKLGNSPKTINHVFLGKDSVAYISTLDGLIIHNLKTNKIKKLSTDEGLPHNNILSTFLDSEHRLWFVAPKSVPGLMQNDSIILFKDIPDFTSYNSTSICEGKDGDIFITTNGDGIYKYSKGVFTQFTIKNGLHSNYVLNAVYDKSREMLICMHHSGFSVFDLGKNKIRAVANKISLNAFESTVNSISIENSIVYFGTEEGLGVYLIDEEKTKCLAPKNSLLRVEINRKVYDPSDSVIYLPYSDYDIKFEFIGVELTYPDQVIYTYKLEGYNNNFKSTKERQLEFNKLSEGKYTLVLFSTNYLGISSALPLRISIYVDKPVYKKWWFLISLLLVLIVTVYLVVRIKTTQLRRQRIILQKKVRDSTLDIVRINKILEIKNFTMMSDIDYAQRIQNVLLPKMEHIKEKLDVFVFHQAKDVVSGDFYWFHSNEKYTYIASVDCTGHGVSGAFMSIIGIFFLDQILAETHDPVPSFIVKQLDSRIVQSLRQRDRKDGVADGMDAAICRIDKANKQVMFCGAHRPLYYVSKGEFAEIKSSRFSAGGFILDERREFTDDVMNYQEGDMLYLFSDGFADQFGGNSNRRYFTKRLKELLTNLSSRETQDQYNYIKTEFNDWKGNLDQTDDVLVVGVKL